MPLSMQVGLSRGNFVFHGDPAPLPKRGRSPQFSAYVYCGQTAAWIKMPLGREVGLGPDDIVFDGDPPPPPPKGGGAPPQFSAHVYCGKAAGWIKMALGMEVGLGPGLIVLDGDPAPRPKKTGQSPSNFRPIFTARRSARNAKGIKYILAIAIPSVCLSVRLSICPSHAGIVSPLCQNDCTLHGAVCTVR